MRRKYTTRNIDDCEHWLVKQISGKCQWVLFSAFKTNCFVSLIHRRIVSTSAHSSEESIFYLRHSVILHCDVCFCIFRLCLCLPAPTFAISLIVFWSHTHSKLIVCIIESSCRSKWNALILMSAVKADISFGERTEINWEYICISNQFQRSYNRLLLIEVWQSLLCQRQIDVLTIGFSCFFFFNLFNSVKFGNRKCQCNQSLKTSLTSVLLFRKVAVCICERKIII